MTEPPFVRSILHATDFSEASRAAFAHALAIAVAREASLAILHAGRPSGDGDEWTRFPHVRETLEAWGMLDAGSPRAAVFEKLRVRVVKVNYEGDPLEATLGYVARHAVDLLVLGTEQREGLPRWVRQSTAAKLARSTEALSLIVPEGVRGFVAPDTGEVRLRHILVPVDRKPDPSAALEYASRACSLAPGADVVTTVLHVGEHLPELDLPTGARCTYEVTQRSGEVVDRIVAVAEEKDADLVVMASDGRDGVLDVFRGSHSERVARRVPCPLLVVPQAI